MVLTFIGAPRSEMGLRTLRLIAKGNRGLAIPRRHLPLIARPSFLPEACLPPRRTV
jgi:hypothetical protein